MNVRPMRASPPNKAMIIRSMKALFWGARRSCPILSGSWNLALAVGSKALIEPETFLSDVVRAPNCCQFLLLLSDSSRIKNPFNDGALDLAKSFGQRLANVFYL
jgi:hypothetical protein